MMVMVEYEMKERQNMLNRGTSPGGAWCCLNLGLVLIDKGLNGVDVWSVALLV